MVRSVIHVGQIQIKVLPTLPLISLLLFPKATIQNLNRAVSGELFLLLNQDLDSDYVPKEIRNLKKKWQ